MMLWQWLSQTEIADKLWYSQPSISKEIWKWTINGKYDAIYAEKVTQRLREDANRTHTKLTDTKLWQTIVECLENKEEDRSPDTIVWRMKSEWYRTVCTKTVYNYINKHDPWVKKLLRHGKKWYRNRWTQETRWSLWEIMRIDVRDKQVETRETYNHWEIDTIISWTRKCRIATAVERKSRYVGMKKTSSGQAIEVSQKIIDIGVEVWIEKFETITSDNWKEFADWEVISYRLQSLFYFANPYHSRERGTNENWNRCIRKHLPKGTEFENITDAEIEKIQTMINNKPRKILNYRTPTEELFGEKRTYFSHYAF